MKGGTVRSDAELLAKVGGRDEDAFAELYERFADRVYRYALTVLRDRHLAEEVTQETMLAVWKGAKGYSGRSKASTWIFGIARNQAHRLIERETRARRAIEGEDRAGTRGRARQVRSRLVSDRSVVRAVGQGNPGPGPR